MTLLDSILLGLIQGLTEFLPISSSAHLVLGNALLGLQSPKIIFEVFLHFATFLATVLFFWKELCALMSAPLALLSGRPVTEKHRTDLRWLGLIVVATIPAAVVGVLFEHQFEQAFSSVREVGWELLITTVLLFLTWLARPTHSRIRWLDSVLIGIAQAVSILPGISRSGSTISTALYLGVDRPTAFNFSFILSLPAIFGAFVLKLREALQAGLSSQQLLLYLPGMLVAFVIGYLSLVVLRRVVISGKFAYFGVYTLIAGLATLLLARG